MPLTLQSFVDRWSGAQRAERANYQLFLSELCEVLDLPRPDPAGPDAAANAYVFERAVRLHRSDGKVTTGRIDLYRRGCFVLECKQYGEAKPESAALALDFTDDPAPRSTGIVRGTEAWDRKMHEAREQAKLYVESLPLDEDPPPFIVTVDVGHSFEFFADFSQKGKAYLHHPDARTFRIRLRDLLQEEPRERLRAVWIDPHSLDQSKKAAAVTREVAEYLANLARLFEKDHEPQLVAAFLSRCLFCMFAEDVGLLPQESFKQLLDSVKGDPRAAVPLLKGLFEEMNRGGYSLVLREKLLHFNGGLFADAAVLPLDGPQLGLLRKAASLEWRHVEPAIFGTLLERALDPAERHKLGAHYTPRAYVERLVLPTVIEPLRDEWENVRAAAITRATRSDLKGAIKETRAFHHRLCGIRVLDPACGSGNFLYVTLEHMKRLEGEVLELVESFGDNMRLDLAGETVDPHQFLGLELNPRAASVAELVLWIGHLQWHHRNRGSTHWPEPVLRAFRNIECRDAVLAYDGKPQPITTTMAERKPPLPGVDDNIASVYRSISNGFYCETKENADGSFSKVPVFAYENPRTATWPEADFIVGNPPFIGNKRMRDDLGSGYVETLRMVYPETLESADLVMFWWHKAAELVRSGKCRRFGFITTNSIRQSSNRQVLRHHLIQATDSKAQPSLALRMAIPDHPWVESAEGAAVRIAMTVAGIRKPDHSGKLCRVVAESPTEDGEVLVRLEFEHGIIHPDLTVGADIGSMPTMRANNGLSFMGVSLIGQGFLVTTLPKEEAEFVRPFIIGRDLNQPPEKKQVIDFFELSADEARKAAPRLFEKVLADVKPERDQNNRAGYREKWWLYGEQRSGLRHATRGLKKYIVTCRTAKHRIFSFVPGKTIPESTIIAIASDDAFHLGVLSSRVHVVYALAAGGTLEDRPRYNNSLCFDPFPFPECTETQKAKIRKLGEELDAHRKRAQQQHGLGLTDIYNVLEKLRSASAVGPDLGQAAPDGATKVAPYTQPLLTTKEQAIHDAALVSTLRHLHEELDAAVADAYGWPWPLADEDILERVVALNAARAAEEANGTIRWLRPEYQLRNADRGLRNEQTSLALTEGNALDSKSTSRRSVRGKTPPATPQSEIRNPKSAAKRPWPKPLAERAQAVEAALTAEPKPVTAAELATRFARAKPEDVAETLDTLAALGRARRGDITGTFLR